MQSDMWEAESVLFGGDICESKKNQTDLKNFILLTFI